MDISANTIVQNKRNLRLVVLVLNTDDGHIVNAADTRIGASSTDAIASPISKASCTPQRYDLTGRRLSDTSAGRPALQIVRLSDGTTKKIIVKQ